MSEAAGKPVDNGVNVEALLGARAALTEAPEAAQFTWRAKCEWVNGTHSRSTVESFFGLGEEHNHKSTFTLEADHPEVFASEDHAATPVEQSGASEGGSSFFPQSLVGPQSQGRFRIMYVRRSLTRACTSRPEMAKWISDGTRDHDAKSMDRSGEPLHAGRGAGALA